MAAPTGAADEFVIPDPSSSVSGGNLYNAALIRALKDQGHLDEGPALAIVDSLYLPTFAAMAREFSHRCPTGLLVHYLPSLVIHGDALDVQQLQEFEREAIGTASFFIVTSVWMQRTLIRLGAHANRIAIVLPGADNPARVDSPAGANTRALMLAPLTRAKGVAEFLSCLAAQATHGDQFVLDIAGGGPEAEESSRAESLASAPTLSGHVRLHGELPHPQCMQMLSNTDIFVSASRMESFGMALAEARQAGVPIVARQGGAVRDHVLSGAGGKLCVNASELAGEFLRLVRDRAELDRRIHLAHLHVPPPRPWSMVATDYRNATAAWRAFRPGT